MLGFDLWLDTIVLAIRDSIDEEGCGAVFAAANYD